MKYKNNPKCFFNIIRTVGTIIAIWPSKIYASRKDILFYEIKWWIALLNATSLLIPLVLGVYYFRNDSITVTKTLSELTALCEVFINLIQCRIQRKNFQVILYEIEEFIKNTDGHEEVILQNYIDRYKNFQMFVVSSFVSTAILFTSLPMVTSQILPADAWYPFQIESFPVWISLYVTQVLAIFQTGLNISVDVTVATMLWYCAAQTELLDMKLKKAISGPELKKCALSHQELTVFTNNVIKGIKFLILKTNGTMIVAVVCGAFQLIHHEPLEVLIRFILMVVAGCLRLYISAKPADDLKANNEHLAQTAFHTALLQNSTDASKIALMLAFRCQKPVVISVTGIIKAYTLQYYASFLSTSVTYFVNLRAILDG